MSNKKSLLPKSGIAGLNGTEYLSEENKNINLKRYVPPMFIAALFTIAKIWKQPRCPPKFEWIKKMLYIYIYIYIFLHSLYTVL